MPATVKVAALRAAGTAVVVVSALADPLTVRRMLAAGALGYVPKSEPVTQLVQAAVAASRGQSYVVETVLLSRVPLPRPPLSDREQQTLCHYVSDLPMKSVARRLDVKPDTASSYLKRVKAKYAAVGRPARTKLELHQRAVEDGWLARGEGATGG